MKSFSLLLIALGLPLAHGAGEYKTADKKCYGFPQIPSLKTRPGECVGLVADNGKVAWNFPRKLLFDGEKLYVAAFGGWVEKGGQVWELNVQGSQDDKRVQSHKLFDRTNQTHGIRKGPDGKIYFADKETLFRFDPSNPTRLETVLANLESNYVLSNGQKIGNHPLKEFIFLPSGDLVINMGSPSNDCSEEVRLSGKCDLRDKMASIRRYPYISANKSFSPKYQTVAKGLRNSMGLMYNPKLKEIYQAENGADELGTPDELNVIEMSKLVAGKGYDFGWPYCSGDGLRYKGYSTYKNFCERAADRPYLLFPAHSAPLELMYYNGNMFSDLKGSIISAWHGHRPSGSRIAIYATDDSGRPKKSVPSMLVDGWQADRRQRHPKGRPVGMAVDPRGAIFVVDDVNDALLVIAKSGDTSNNANDDDDDQKDVEIADLDQMYSAQKLKDWDDLFPKIFKAKKCSECHGDVVIENSARQTLVNMINQNWIISDQPGHPEQQPVWKRMTGIDEARIMPPRPKVNLLDDQRSRNGLFELLQSWF